MMPSAGGGQAILKPTCPLYFLQLAMGKMMEQGPVLIITFQAQLVMVIRNPKGEVVEGDPVSRGVGDWDRDSLPHPGPCLWSPDTHISPVTCVDEEKPWGGSWGPGGYQKTPPVTSHASPCCC
jgi:hypothetical protein